MSIELKDNASRRADRKMSCFTLIEMFPTDDQQSRMMLNALNKC